MDAPAPTSRTYDLAFTQDGARFWWRNPNAGVTLTDAGQQSCLTWTTAAGPVSRLWTEIVAVSLSSATAGRGAINQCRIAFRGGRSLTVTDASASGLPDGGRTPVYRDFVRALHARLAHAPAGTISFNAGMSESRYRGLQAIMAVAALFFGALPLALLVIVRDWHVLFILAAGLGLLWPFWKVMQNNRPRTYDPKYPPGELME